MQAPNPTTQDPTLAWRRAAGSVWALGVVAFCMDLSSESVHSLLPIYVVAVLGASPTLLGVLEGLASATALLTRVVSGFVSDAFARRKPLVVAGYGLAALTKPLFPLANGIGLVVVARLLDRVGKGIRGAPRDALIADLVPRELYGKAYGLRRTCDSLGAALGPLVAVALLATVTRDDVRSTLWIAAAPAVLAVVVLVVFVREPQRPPTGPSTHRTIASRDELARLPGSYWRLAGWGTLLGLARCSEAFVVLRAHDVGARLELVPLALFTLGTAEALVAYPVGAWSDRLGRRGLLRLGIVLLVAASAVLATADGLTGVLVGAALWGLHFGCSKGLLDAAVADVTPAALRGTAFGAFRAGMGLALLFGSVLAGLLWERHGASVTFTTTGALAAIAWIAMPRLGTPRTSS